MLRITAIAAALGLAACTSSKPGLAPEPPPPLEPREAAIALRLMDAGCDFVSSLDVDRILLDVIGTPEQAARIASPLGHMLATVKVAAPEPITEVEFELGFGPDVSAVIGKPSLPLGWKETHSSVMRLTASPKPGAASPNANVGVWLGPLFGIGAPPAPADRDLAVSELRVTVTGASGESWALRNVFPYQGDVPNCP